ncbi:winged helix-turn-helix domain-containing protein [Streptomyces cavernicola]|uniref:Winged helix-turn-helix domain-containing protein n=1 Tax=Streptomyces cavernicola TaxID=3043613 RepID=A0ABT6S6X8_9ACTN|nr:winged helix-turn-helix domain-containing protein [Streptomyces sp. B-S-A6]MDI3403850.1 winged helix-turn-helix domain-containing protein [Streptomyces sp. B-S-A6]
MTTAVPSRTPVTANVLHTPRHLRLVREDDAREFVGYLVLLPAGTDPTELFARSGIQPEARALAPERDSVQRDLLQRDAAQRDPLQIDAERRVAVLDGRELDLTYLEFELLAQLVRNPRRVYSREYLVERVWGHGHIGDGRTVDVHVARLRRKFGAGYRGRIVTVRRVGYKYVPDAS